MPTAIPDIILLDDATGTGAGNGVGIQGQGMRYQNRTGVANTARFPTKFKVHAQLVDVTTGASATILIEESDDDSTYTTNATIALVIGADDPNQVAAQMGNGFLVSTQKRYVRANLSALTGGSAPAVNAYMTLGTYGV